MTFKLDQALCQRIFRAVGFITFLFIFSSFLSSVLAAPGDTPKKVLLIFSHNIDYPGIALTRKGFSAAFAQHTHLGLPYSLEEFQLADPDDEEYFNTIVSDLKAKYAKDKPDLIVAGYKQATEFMARYGSEIFGDVPVVFAGMDIENYSSIHLPANYYGIITSFCIQNNIEMILQNHPAVKTIYVIAGASPAEREMVADTMKISEMYKDRVEFIVPNQAPYYHMLAMLNSLPKNSVVLYLTMQIDINRRLLAPTVVARDISRAAKAPVYGILDAYSGSGITGGFLIDHESLGRQTADISLSILNGTPTLGLHMVSEPIGMYSFDWRELKRWGITESSLPAGSRIEFREFSAWEAYKWQIIGGVCLLLLQGFLILGLLVNLSIRRKTQMQLLCEREFRARSEKMASIGMLAAGIAHEINQPLNAIKLISSGLVFGYKQGKERDKAELILNLEEISRQASRVADIVDHLRALIHRDDSRLKPCDINAAVHRVLGLAGQQLAAHGISVETKLGDGLPAVMGVPTALEEVVINLLINSMQALDTMEKSDKRVEIRTWYNEGIVLEVSDNGPGVNPKLGSKIFEPFVSTKATAESLGLGLAIINNIVTMYGGTIRHESSEIDGARFIIKFPNRDNERRGGFET